jgi:hypothetical protein
MDVNSVRWVKAKASGGNGGNCVEVAFGPDGRAAGMMRDSKRPHYGHLTIAPGTFAEFIADVKAGRLDLPRLSQPDRAGSR